MIKRYISLLILFALIGGGMSCAKKEAEPTVAEQGITQQESASTLNTKPQGKQRARNQGTQAVGRGFQNQRSTLQEKTWSSEDVVELSDEEKRVVEIETVTASIKPLRSQLKALGKVFAHPRRQAIVSYAFPARISEIHVRVGEWVKTGQELITLQSEEVGIAKSDFYKAKADYELVKTNCERSQRLYERGVGSEKEALACEAEFKVAEAHLNATEKKLHVLGFTEAQVQTIAESHQINPVITLFSPINGKILEFKVVIGAMVDQSTEILTILNPEVLVVDAEIYEKDISKIKIEQQVEVSVPAYPGEIFGGKISYISDVLNEKTRTITVRMEVENREYKLKPGMFAEISIYLNNQNKALVLPREAILDEKDEHMVFLKIEDKYAPVIVELGARENGFVEILQGIQVGDEVVTIGNFQLKSKLYDAILQKGHIH
ncbi:efflux RND transporter periplasmic adaptor subunit [Acidobacteriota bacterium]